MKIFSKILLPCFLVVLMNISLFPGEVQAVDTPCVSPPPFGAGRVLTDGEIVLADHQLNTLRGFKYQQGTENFTEFPVGPRNLQTYDELVVADMDGQGTDEIIIGDASDNKIHIYTASLGEITSFGVAFERYDDLAVGDVDGDGNKEIILGDASDPQGQSIQIFRMDGTKIGWIKVSGGYERYDRIAVGDLDGNGVDEIIHGNASTGDDSIHIYKWNESAEGHVSELQKFNVNYSRYDEIAVADVDNDGEGDIIFGCGSSSANPDIRHRITVYDIDGNVKAQSADIGFSGTDELAAGDVDMDGRAEIVVGKDSDHALHVYKVGEDGDFLPLDPFDVNYRTGGSDDDRYDGEKIAIGDLDGGSITVGDPICRGQMEIDDQVMAVINAPPKQEGVNSDPGNFLVKYEHSQTETTSNTVTAVTGFTFSTKITGSFNIGVTKAKISMGWKYNHSKKSQSGTSTSVQVGEGLTADQADRKVALTTTYDVFEYPILDENGNQEIMDGEPQYLMVTLPVSIGTPTLGYYQSSIHTLDNVTSYPPQESKLVHYLFDPIYNYSFIAGPDPSSGFIKKSETYFNSQKTSSSIKISVSAAASYMGSSASISGDYQQQFIATHKIEFKEDTSLKIEYAGGISDENKYYTAHAVAYYDSEDGHLVLDWVVPSYGSFYTASNFNPWMPNLVFTGNLWQYMSISLPLPVGHQRFEYHDDQGTTLRNQEPANCRPLGFKNPDSTLNLQVDLPTFDAPVDIYLAFYAPDLDADHIYLFTPGGIEVFTDTLIPWRSFSSGDINESVFGDIPLAHLPVGTYYFYLLASPANGNPVERYYLWGTSFTKQIYLHPLR
ncbi:MAG: hypothetical protein J7K15_13355 [Deltaproteobacteria bacterium]|nr:hypothetical protein [Deltaproteobacteria bacterium]